MAFGPIMQFEVNGLKVELAPLSKEVMGEFVARANGGGMQQFSITRYMGMGNAPVLEDEEEWFEKNRQAKDSLNWGIWIVEGTARTLIGNSAVFNIGKEGHTPFIRQAITGSMIFRKDFHGKGIASAAHKARTWFAFTQAGVHRLKSAVIRENVGSRTALERSGYTFVYLERNEQFSDGRLRHMDNLECLNPLDLFWSQWWHGDRITKKALEARQVTLEAMAWAEQNVKLL